MGYEIENKQQCKCPDCGCEYETWDKVTWDEDPDAIGPVHYDVHREHCKSHTPNGQECLLFQIRPRCSRNRSRIKNLKRELDNITNAGREIDHAKLGAIFDDMLKDADEVRVLFKKMYYEPIVEDEFGSDNPFPGI